MWEYAIVALAIILCLLVLSIAPVCCLPENCCRCRPLPGTLERVGRVLVVTAHPDDECMFFAPTIVNLLREGRHVYLLCLSTGNRYGLGKTRKQELLASCDILGLPSENMTIVSHTNLPDDSLAVWNTNLVARLILKQVQALDIDTLISFDENGVSGHQNHRAIHRAIRYLIKKKQLPPACRPYAIQDVCLLRKYVGLLDVPFTCYSSKYVYVATDTDTEKAKVAMAAHESQDVWFRKLYIRFSRYVIVNDLRQLDFE